MKKRLLCLAVALLQILLFATACGGGNTPDPEETTPSDTLSDVTSPPESETEPVVESPYQIPGPPRFDL